MGQGCRHHQTGHCELVGEGVRPLGEVGEELLVLLLLLLCVQGVQAHGEREGEGQPLSCEQLPAGD